MTSSPLTVVVASVNGFPYLGRCLDSLEASRPRPDVIVADWTDGETRSRVRAGWTDVRLLSFDRPMAVPELRAAGIFAAESPYVAVIEDHCIVPPGWTEAALERHEQGRPVVGGPVRNVATERVRDWAAFLCEYAEQMEPMPDGPAEGLTGMNVSYDRRALAAMEEGLRQGRWETWLHPRLAEREIPLWRDHRMVLLHAKDFGVREFASQRYHYARSHAGMRNADLGRRRVLYLVGWPLIPAVMYARIARAVLARRRHRRELALASPLLLAYLVVWALGEAVGHALGGGRSLLRVR